LLGERAFGELAGGGSIRKGNNKLAAEDDGGFWPLLVISEWLPDLFGVLLALSFVPTRKGVLADFGSSLGRGNKFERRIKQRKLNYKTMIDSSPPKWTGVLRAIEFFSPSSRLELKRLTFTGVSSTELSVSSIISSSAIRGLFGVLDMLVNLRKYISSFFQNRTSPLLAFN
jgi:hypothetical protein